VVFERGLTQQLSLKAKIEALGGTVDGMDAGGFILQATLTPDQLLAILHHDEVLYVNRASDGYTEFMDIARVVSGANYVEMLANHTGAGVRGALWDGRPDSSHQEFQGVHAPIYVVPAEMSGSPFPHGTSTFGILFAPGIDPMARGMLPDAQGVFKYVPATLVARRGYARMLVVPDANDPECPTLKIPYDPNQNDEYFCDDPDFTSSFEALFLSRSYTDSSPPDFSIEYDEVRSALWDQIVFDNDLLVCQSQGNTGVRETGTEAWAKNIVSVGGVHHYDNVCLEDDSWSGPPPVSSIGPAEDGRNKPDLTHFIDQVYTTTLTSFGSYTSLFGGTSAAAPIVCGHFGLLFEMWGKPRAPGATTNIFGRELNNPNGSVFENRPHAMTAKAMMINTARPYFFDDQLDDLTRVHQGWGRPDVRKLHELRDRFPIIIDESVVLQELEVYTTTVQVSPNTPALRMTMVYKDPPGMPSFDPARVNDLTLRALSPSQVKYVGNWGLKQPGYGLPGDPIVEPGLWSLPDGEVDTVDTVENIFIQNPEAGTWTITVRAEEIGGDGHPPTPAWDADFALVVSLEPATCNGTPAVVVPCRECSEDADCCDANVCSFNDCHAGECDFFPIEYGNVDGSPNQTPNLDDIFCALDCFATSGVDCPNADIAPPCTGNGICDLDDVVAVSDAFMGLDPCGCP
jgi:hypothetical protein